MNKPRLAATHFIEVYGAGSGVTSQTLFCSPLKNLQNYLDYTADKKILYTVAIFKIKEK